ncbi:MAG: choice-of-anchor tandem repeat NxxGxxAF-containing protein [Sandaracinaceae bacterium]
MRAQVFDALAEVGDPAPAVAADLADLDVPVIGADRDIALAVTLGGSGVDATNDSGLLVVQAGGRVNALAAREGEQLPDADGASTAFPELRLAPGPRLVFRAAWSSSNPSGGDGVYAWSAGAAAPTAIARTGAPVPDEPELLFRLFSQLRAGPSGDAVHWNSGLSSTTGGAFEDSIGGAVGSAPAALRLSEASLDPSYGMFSTNFRASPGGRWALAVTVTETSPFARYRALMLDGSAVLREGDVGLEVFSVVGLNDAARVLFFGGTRSGGQTSLWVHDAGSTTSVAEAGDVTPIAGTTWGAETFTDATRVALGEAGHVALRAHLDGAPAATDEAVLVLSPDLSAWTVLSREGDDAPGVSGATFGTLTRTASSLPENTVAINARGDVLIRALLEGPGVDAGTRDALFVSHAGGSPELLVREGQEVLVDGDPHTLVGFDVQLGSGGQDGLPTGYGDDGRIALRIDLVPGDPASMPDPGVGRRRLVGVLEDSGALRRIGAAPIGGLVDGGPAPDGGVSDGGAAPRSMGGCAVSAGSSPTASLWPLAIAALVLGARARRRRTA